jgi:hypothetical protein
MLVSNPGEWMRVARVERVALACAPKGAQRAPRVRPPLKWAGGKRWQIPELEQFWKGNSNLRLVEPFCGGLAVGLGLMPARALLNDINPHLINFYHWLKRGLTISSSTTLRRHITSTANVSMPSSAPVE